MPQNNQHIRHTWVYIFFTTLALYVMTMAQTVIWGDSADIALKVHNLVLDPAADGHPLYILLGRVFSWLPGELAVNLNFMSVFFAALAVTFVYLIVEKITKNHIQGIIAAVCLTLSHAFWLHALVTEVYVLNAFFVTLIVWLMLCWKDNVEEYKWLYAASFVFGLSLSHHLIIGLCGFGGLYFMIVYGGKRLLNARRIALIAFFFLLGSSLYWGLLLRWFLLMPQKTAEIVDIATGRGHKQYMLHTTIFRVLKNIGLYIALLFYQFPLAGFILGILGIIGLMKKDARLGWFFLLLIGVNSLFFIFSAHLQYNYQFIIQDYMLFSILIGYGSSSVLYWMKNNLFNRTPNNLANMLLLGCICVFPIITYKITPPLSKKLGLTLAPTRPLPYRNNETYFLDPPKTGYTGPEEYAFRTFSLLKPDAIIIADFTPAAVLEYYQQIMGMRPDVKLVYLQKAGDPKDNNELKPFVDKFYGKRPIYLGDFIPDNMRYYYNAGKLLTEYNLIALKPIYLVEKQKNRF